MNQSSPKDPRTRFSDRVENYIKYRPSYPIEIVSFLKKDLGLSQSSTIADIGSGTGILSKMLLENGNAVYGIEPNTGMREAAEKLLAGYEQFKSLNATAEKTSLDDQSVDFITAGQAFHWFDAQKAKAEFSRILKPDGFVILIWNVRQIDTTPFSRGYEKLLNEFGTDYSEIRKTYSFDEMIETQFFTPGECFLKTFKNKQVFDFEGLKGRLLSSSYAPNVGQNLYKPMIEELNNIFEKHNDNGGVSFDYMTQVFYGKVTQS